MEPVNSTTPSWLVGLLIVFAIATGATFILLLARHAELNSLSENYSALTDLSNQLEYTKSQLKQIPPVLDQKIRDRKGTISSLLDLEHTTIADVDRLVSRNQETLKAIGEAQTKELAKYNDLMQEMASHTKDLGAGEDHQYAEDRSNDDQRRNLRDEVEKISQVIAEHEKEGRRRNAELDDRISYLEARVRQLTEEQDLAKRVFKAAGEIVASAAADGFVVINRGHRQNLRNGTKFVVFEKRGGRIVTKGVIQVIEVKDDIATARVMVESDRNDPLIAGDLLHNPIYDPDKVLHFAIRGDFMRFSKEELAQFIKDSGDIVDPDISLRSDYLVAGANCRAALDQATNLGVSILSEDQMLNFVTERPHIASGSDLVQIKHAANAGRTFALIGSFNVANRSAVERWIERNGGKTTGGVHDGVDIVIAGDGDDKAVAEARKRGIPVIDQGQFAHLDADTH